MPPKFRKPPPTWPPPKKMPVSYFEELCRKKNFQPSYEYLGCDGRDHDAIFIYEARVDDLKGLGRGKNKKMAKHYAVRDLLDKIVDCGRQIEWFGENCRFYGDCRQFLNEILIDLDSMPGGLNEMKAVVAVADDYDNDDGGGDSSTICQNPINSLDELCKKRQWPEAVYCETQEVGLPHDRMFTVRLHLGKFCVEENGRSKKLAKKQAAEAILKLIYEMPLEQRDRDLVIAEDPVEESVSRIEEENQGQNSAENYQITAPEVNDQEDDHQNSNGHQEESNRYNNCPTIDEEEEEVVNENGQFSDPKAKEEELECLDILKNTEWHLVDKPDDGHKNLIFRVSKIFGFKISFTHLPRKPESVEAGSGQGQIRQWMQRFLANTWECKTGWADRHEAMLTSGGRIIINDERRIRGAAK